MEYMDHHHITIHDSLYCAQVHVDRGIPGVRRDMAVFDREVRSRIPRDHPRRRTLTLPLSVSLSHTLSYFTLSSCTLSHFHAQRKNGYYGISTFVIANTIASAPFIFGIALICSLCVYWLVGLNDGGHLPATFLPLPCVLPTF
jgi:hypothetical protein